MSVLSIFQDEDHRMAAIERLAYQYLRELCDHHNETLVIICQDSDDEISTLILDEDLTMRSVINILQESAASLAYGERD